MHRMNPDLLPLVELVEGRHGRFYVLAADQYVSRSLKTYGEWTEDEVALLCQALNPGDTAIDVGANLGSHTIPFARRVGHEGRVLAFEPQPRVFELLRANVELNELRNVELHGAACGAAPGEVELPPVDYAREANFGGVNVRDLEAAGRGAGVSGERIPVVTLDEAVPAQRVRLLKIDVEGMEREVLAGASRLIARSRPFLYVENEAPESSPVLIDAMRQLGYGLHWHVVPFFDPDNVRGRADDVFDGMGCVNVFGAPAEMALNLRGLVPVGDGRDHPRLRGLT